MSADAAPRPVFLFPGPVDTPTGGFRYDRRIVAELTAAGRPVDSVVVEGAWPRPTAAEIARADEALAAIADGRCVIVDGLARSEPERLFAGAILVALLALSVDAIMAVVQRILTPKALRAEARPGRAMTEAVDPILEARRPTGGAA